METKNAIPSRPEPSFFTKLYGIFFSPRNTFDAINRHPDWLTSLVLIIVVSVILAVITIPRITIPEQIAKIAEDPELTYEEIIERQNALRSPVSLVVGVIFTVISIPLILLIKACMIWAVSFFAGGDSAYKKVLSVCTYSTLVSLLGGIIKTPLMIIKNSSQVHTSLVLILSPEDSDTFLYRIFSQLDIFAVWVTILTVIGISVIYRFSTQKSVAIVGSLWILWILIFAGLGTLIPS